ncbi:hypothetical protein I8751_02360 [Nostocaceae cyanobacterium CENA357]|uniref:Uncharacterized protein n=1 Tax=Atlanticothrix silvestris CENA357 TaxID=1725252 RepID=A0A8J7L3T1_9CYAN|nr:hypothetical protein [Atlanticothrix silvestris]MBH8551242.1 hypothetical protein [Atlanticothrix silvestris CENA357]
MDSGERNFCFCTYAAGKIYRALVKNLLSDIEKFAPKIPVILYTDRPQEFDEYKFNKNILVFGHHRQGVLHYHERRFAIAKALLTFNSCMYLDADVRICAPVPQYQQWLPGITARSCTSMLKHFQERINKTNPPPASVIQQFEMLKKMARKLNVDIDTEDITWINEFLFVVTRDSGKEVQFLKNWEKLALYAELNSLHKHPAYAMGLAAAKAGFSVRHDVMEGLDFFDDRIEKVRIASGQSQRNTKLAYFETQQRIENSHNSTSQKIRKKLTKYSEYLYYAVRLKINTLLKDYKFYYR